MSYEIVYDKQFIKLPNNKFVPMLYWGSNNCTEFNSSTGRERRERNWSVFKYHCDGNFYATKEDILKSVDNFRQGIIDENKERNARYLAEGKTDYLDTYSDKSFGYWSSIAIGGSTRNTTFGMYKGIFNTGIKKALTVEELVEENIRVNISSYLYGSNYEELGLEATYENPKTGQEFIDILNKTIEKYKGTKASVRVSIDASEYQMKWLRKRRFPKVTKVSEPTESVYVKGFWTLKADNGGYFHKLTRRGYRYSFQTPKYVFLTEQEAKNVLSTNRRNQGIMIEYVEDEAFIRLTLEQIKSLEPERIIRRSNKLELA